MRFFYFIILLQGLSISISYGIELNGLMQNIFERYHNSSIIKKLFQLASKHESDNLLKPPKEVTQSVALERRNKGKDLEQYVDHLIERGVDALKYTGQNVKKIIKEVKNIKKKIDVVVKDYGRKMGKYYEFFIEKYKTRPGFNIEDDFMFLNIFEISIGVLYREQWQLFDYAIMTIRQSNKTFNNDTIQNISSFISNQTVEIRKEEMRYICNKYEICKPYPSFTDYFENLIYELLKLPDNKLQTLLHLTKTNLEANEDYLALTSVLDNQNLLFKDLEKFCGNMTIKQALEMTRLVLTQRFRLLHIHVLDQRCRIQAARALLGIIDKEFHYNNDNDFQVDYDTVIKALQMWANTVSSFPTLVVGQFVNNVFKTINVGTSLNKAALLEIIIRGSSSVDGFDKTTFVKGSHGVYI